MTNREDGAGTQPRNDADSLAPAHANHGEASLEELAEAEIRSQSVGARISRTVGAWFPVIVLVAGTIAVLAPAPFLPIGQFVNPLLMLIMLGMGMTLRASDFAIVAKRPYALLIGMLAQFIILPFLAWALVMVLRLDPAIAVGVILVAAAPGGTASNVIVYLAKGDLALSVAMSVVSTLVAPIVTPLLTLWLAGDYLPVDALGMFISIGQIVIIPVIVGVVLRLLIPKVIDTVVEWMPLVSVLGITLVILAVVSGSAATILNSGLMIFAIVIVLNVFGLVLGYLAARLVGLDEAARRSVAIESGMQNSGLAAGLARTHFTPEAAVPAAIFSVWHNLSGSLLAGFWSRRDPSVQRAAPEAGLAARR